MFMEIQDKSIVMSSPIRLSKILVYIRLHEKNGKNAFSKIGFRLGELSDWKVFIVGYTFMEIQDKCIVMSSVVENFGLHLPTREKREKGVSKNQIPLRRAFRLKSGYHWRDVRGKPLLRKKNSKVCNFQQTWWQRPRNFVPCSLGHPLFLVSIQRRGQSKNSIDSEKWFRWEWMSIKTAHTLKLVRSDPKNLWQNE